MNPDQENSQPTHALFSPMIQGFLAEWPFRIYLMVERQKKQLKDFKAINKYVKFCHTKENK